MPVGALAEHPQCIRSQGKAANKADHRVGFASGTKLPRRVTIIQLDHERANLTDRIVGNLDEHIAAAHSVRMRRNRFYDVRRSLCADTRHCQNRHCKNSFAQRIGSSCSVHAKHTSS